MAFYGKNGVKTCLKIKPLHSVNVRCTRNFKKSFGFCIQTRLNKNIKLFTRRTSALGLYGRSLGDKNRND